MLKLYVYVETVTLQFFQMLQCILTVAGARCKISFDIQNSLASVLGFERSIYGVGRHASENLVNIMGVNSILGHCNIFHTCVIHKLQLPTMPLL